MTMFSRIDDGEYMQNDFTHSLLIPIWFPSRITLNTLFLTVKQVIFLVIQYSRMAWFSHIQLGSHVFRGVTPHTSKSIQQRQT